MQMTNEELAMEIGSGRSECVPELYKQCYKLIKIKVWQYYNQYSSRCAECGIEYDDLLNESYFIIETAAKAYCQSDKQYKFTTFLSYPMRTTYNKLLGFRTVGGKNELLNRNVLSLDAPLPGTDDLTYADSVEDIGAIESFEEAEKQADFEVLHEEIGKLSDREQDVIKRHYFENESLLSISKSIGISNSAIHQNNANALRKLRKNKNVRNCFSEYYEALPYRHVTLSQYNHTWMSATDLAAFKRMQEQDLSKLDT